jgi:hypothetical protein
MSFVFPFPTYPNQITVNLFLLKRYISCWRQWLTPVILAQEAEIRRNKLRTNSLRDPILEKPITRITQPIFPALLPLSSLLLVLAN